MLTLLAQGDDRVVENKLLLLQFEKFNLIKFLLRNKWKALHVTRATEKDESGRDVDHEQRGLVDRDGDGGWLKG
ncbi:Brr2, N-terminal helicase PWI domain [Dillenia turbinata]|uniref:Brr2, N-terminal helicase PWI domain n=1 Tax=Dillenia turbinata TaxID=194707 RepID=A0AAN8Z7Z5_9MAGN